MSYDPSNLWSDTEDSMIIVYYQKFGPSWVGWGEVLPNRSYRAIKERARRLGVAASRQPRKAEPDSPRRDKGADRRHYKLRVPRRPDPNEKYVLACLKAGMTPTEIDRKRHWFPRTTIRILTERWARENEQDA